MKWLILKLKEYEQATSLGYNSSRITVNCITLNGYQSLCCITVTTILHNGGYYSKYNIGTTLQLQAYPAKRKDCEVRMRCHYQERICLDIVFLCQTTTASLCLWLPAGPLVTLVACSKYHCLLKWRQIKWTHWHSAQQPPTTRRYPWRCLARVKVKQL